MANESKDFSELTQSSISTNFDVGSYGTYELQSFFYPYHLYVEERIDNDVPKDSKTNLYDLYDAGINNLLEEDWTITIGERITSHTQIYLTNNYETVLSNFSPAAGTYDEIHYDSLITDLSGLEDLGDFDEMSAMVMKWINDYVNDFTINQNPENADDSNLILTQALTADIQTITENILEKVFRNLVQLIRFKRDYRMYGPSSTFYGNCYNSNDDCQNHTAVPGSCFVQYGNHYVVGNKAYEDEITSVGDEINNSVWHIAPSSSYVVANHTHNVTIDIDELKSSITLLKPIITKSNSQGTKNQARYVDSDDGGQGTSPPNGGGIPWGDMAKGGFVCDWTNSGEVQILSSGRYSYSWNSDSSYCKLVSQSNWNANPWGNSDVKLPTYSTRVWVWTHNDTGTNIIDPMQYIREIT